MKALIVVDVQKDFVPGGALAVDGGDQIVPVINRIMDRYDLVVATQDWHPEEHGSFANKADEIGTVVNLQGLEQVLWPEHCVQGESGAEFVAELDTGKLDAVFQKGTDPGIDSYSGLFDNGKLKATGLDQYLQDNNVTEAHIVGLATDYCVKFTALDVAALGIETALVEDACRGVDLAEGDIDRAIDEMRDAGIRVIESEDLVPA